MEGCRHRQGLAVPPEFGRDKESSLGSQRVALTLSWSLALLENNLLLQAMKDDIVTLARVLKGLKRTSGIKWKASQWQDSFLERKR